MSQTSHLAQTIVAPKQRVSDHYRAPTCVGNWQLVQLAGHGEFTEVHCARPLGCRPDWPADYALKMLRPSRSEDPLAIQLIRREAEVGSQVSQAHLVPILEARVREAPHYVVMPRLSGAALSRVIARVGALAARQALWITRQVAEALKALHAKGWYHGDIKPQNIIVSTEGHATLIDLGFALRSNESHCSGDRLAMGTLNYVAPEVLTSALRSDQRSDLYSLGITLFEMLTGRVPFPYNSPGKLVEAHRSEPLPNPCQLVTDLSSRAATLLRRMTAKEPLRRPQSAADLIEELVQLELEAIRGG